MQSMSLSAEAYSFAPNKGGWSLIWDEEPEVAMGSVNAGDPALYVGGGGVNAAFARSLDCPGAYAALHKAAIGLALKELTRESRLETVDLHRLQQPTEFCASIEECYVRLVPELAEEGSFTTGAVFIDVFRPVSRPLHPNNKAMIYVVGPQGRGRTRESFLEAVELTARNFMLAVNSYNSKACDSRLELVRMCLISGGIFKHKSTTKDDVALAIVRGILKHWRPTVSPRIDFAWDQNAFQNAVGKLEE